MKIEFNPDTMFINHGMIWLKPIPKPQVVNLDDKPMTKKMLQAFDDLYDILSE